MARESTLRKIIEPETSVDLSRPAFAGGDPPAARSQPVVSNARLALLMFIAAEAMFFAGLIGAFIVFRLASPAWPPPFQPRLPVEVTGVNTAVLLLSGLAMFLAMRASRRSMPAEAARWLSAAAALGTVFLAVQGYEWVRLIRYGLVLSSGVYGSTFYTLIGCHGAHVLGALFWLLVILYRARKSGLARNDRGVQLCGIYWTFVVALWPFLYALVYLY
jgi:heme/copper-type cytochrome/quinol oxidase subunit 3